MVENEPQNLRSLSKFEHSNMSDRKQVQKDKKWFVPPSGGQIIFIHIRQ
jgi:hypothetical protein